MATTNSGDITPGGTAANKLPNPPSKEVGPKDSGVGHPLCNPFGRSSKLPRSPTSSNDNIFQYEKENAELRRKLCEIEKVTAQLNEEFMKLKKENEELRNSKQTETTEKPQATNNSDIDEEFHTDEEELERETEWILQKKKRPSKKRKAEYSPEVAECSQPKSNVPSRSQPNILERQHAQEQQQPKPKERAPPPINVIGIPDYDTIKQTMKSVTDKEYRLVSLNNGVWKINTPDSESYRALASKLNADGFEWHTYEDKNDRPIKVMARGLHPTCSKEDILDDLTQKGLQIEDAVNIIKKEKVANEQGVQFNRRGLPLFMLTFNKKEKIENVFNIKAILNMRVKIEPLKKTTGLIPQCKKCQGFNHTQKYCQREPRCVKCAGKHVAQACPISKSTPPKCINCKKQHPANYRGCEVAKELQKLRNRPRQFTQITRNAVDGNQMKAKLEHKSLTRIVGEQKTYSQVTQQESACLKGTDDTPVLVKILKTIEAMNIRLIKQERSLEAINKRLDQQERVNEITSMIY